MSAAANQMPVQRRMQRRMTLKPDAFSDEPLNVVMLRKKSHEGINTLVQRIQCDCGRLFSETRYFKYHKIWECGRVLRCEFCPREFNTKSNLKQHKKRCQPNLHNSQNGKLPFD